MVDHDVREALAEQLKRIETLSALHDAGDEWEALKLAKPLCAIFHQTAQAPSLLARSGSRFLSLLSTCGSYPPAMSHWPAPGFTTLRPSNVPPLFICVPNLGNSRTKKDVAFDRWWTGETVFLHGHHKIRRRDLVLHAVNRSGGGQPETALPREYPAIIEGMATKPEFLPAGSPHAIVPLHQAHYASLRQISHEVMHSPELLKLVRPAT